MLLTLTKLKLPVRFEYLGNTIDEYSKTTIFTCWITLINLFRESLHFLQKVK